MRNIRTCGAFVLFAALVGLSTPTGGQGSSPTAEDLFDNGVLQRIDLSINTRDFEKLKANFQENDYYPVTIAWRGHTMRNAWARSRGSGSRSGTKPGLRVDFNRNASGAQHCRHRQARR